MRVGRVIASQLCMSQAVGGVGDVVVFEEVFGRAGA